MYKVLIVDDEKPVRIAIGKLGKWAKFGMDTPVMASNGKEALAVMREIHPDIVFVDIQMPIMSGLDFLEQASKEFPETRFIIISGYDDFSYAQKAIRYQVIEYLLKPVEEEDLNNAILRAVKSICPEFKPHDEKPDVTNLDSDRVIEIIHDYIEKNYSQNIKISHFSDEYFFSKEYLTRQFKAKYGCGIYEYVLQVRMTRARQLLQNQDMKIQDIAQRVGYADKNYFSKAFRTYYGVSPTEFRGSFGE